MDGGTGDVSIFSLARSAHAVAQSGSHDTVTAKTGTDGIDTVTNVEAVRSSNGDVAVANILAGNVADATPCFVNRVEVSTNWPRTYNH